LEAGVMGSLKVACMVSRPCACRFRSGFDLTLIHRQMPNAYRAWTNQDIRLFKFPHIS
jgi:hypothetical protein